MKLTIIRKGEEFVLKMCPGCGDEWYAKHKQNRCTLCGTGLVMRTKENMDVAWDKLKPEVSRSKHHEFLAVAGLRHPRNLLTKRSL